MKSRKQVLKKLFLSTLYLSAFTFGGGYVIVTQHSWLSLQEFADLVAIAEMTPGPIAINAATFVGTRLAGVPGALTATLGGRGHDRLGRRPDSDERSLGRRGRDACGHELGHGGDFCRLPCPAPQNKAQPDPRHASGPSICCCRHSRTDAPADVRHSSYMGFSPFSAADGAGADIR